MVPVLAAVISRHGSVLIAQRARDKRHGGLWEFPGGKIHAGETLIEAARRELNEELGMSVTSVGRILFEQQDPGSSFLIRFLEVDAEGDATPTEFRPGRPGYMAMLLSAADLLADHAPRHFPIGTRRTAS